MTWTGATPSTVTWGADAATSKTYSAGAVSTIAWQIARPQPEASDTGIDFEYQLRNTGYLLLSEDRPFPLVSSLSEGSP